MKKYILSIAMLINCSLAAQAQQTRTYSLIMRNTGKDTMWDGKVITTWGFAPNIVTNTPIPSPTLTANEGDTVIIKVRNISQGDPHTIHLHGLDVDQANDGVPGTSFALEHMEDSSYRFVARHAGTYIYHCHFISVVHVQMGMYGSIIVYPKDGAKTAWTNGPAYHSSYNWLMSEVDKSWHDTVPGGNNHSDMNMGMDTVRIPEYKPDYFLINGNSEQQLNDAMSVHAKRGEKIYLRLTNIGYTFNRVIFPSAFQAEIIASDGRPLPSAVRKDSVRVCPGERYGVMLSPTADMTGFISVQYVDMNNRQILNTQKVPVTVSGDIGMEENRQEPPVSVYPNPANDRLFITGLQPGKLQIVLSNVLGQTVKSQVMLSSGGGTELNTGDVSNGMYIVHIQQGSKQYSRKLLIQH